MSKSESNKVRPPRNLGWAKFQIENRGQGRHQDLRDRQDREMAEAEIRQAMDEEARQDLITWPHDWD